MPVFVGAHGLYRPVGAVGGTPSAPQNVTKVMKDAGAKVSFLVPASSGTSSITSYTVTPYISGAAQTPTTVNVGSLGSITGSDGNTYKQADVTGLTNSTAYTFTVKATNGSGAGPESTQTGADTPLSGLVYGDHFNDSTIDPEWWVYTRCGYLAQSEVQYYLPSQVTLDGSSNLVLTAEHTSHTGPSYPSAGGGNVTQPWISGAVQGNTRLFAPTSGNTMTFEVRQQLNAHAGDGYWPGLTWLEGQANIDTWKTDPVQGGWNSTDHAEIDIAEWNSTGSPNSYLSNVAISSFETDSQTTTGLATSMNIFSVQWKPGTSCKFFRNGSQTFSATTKPASGAQFFILIYLQMLAGGLTATESCLIDYVRVYDQNLG